MDRKGATSIGCAKPVKRGPITLPLLNSFSNLIEIAAACIEGINKMGMFPDIKLSIRKPGGGTKLNAIVEVNLVMILKQCYS